MATPHHPRTGATGLVRSASHLRPRAARLLSANLGQAIGRRLSAQVLAHLPNAPAGGGSQQCSIVAFDVVAFGDRRRDDDVQLYVRSGLYRIIEKAFDAVGVPWRACHREDRGDGVLVVVPAPYATES
ncbi:MAG TPA: hypothetical protein VE198_15015, partial [Actinoallomurus sp.]|nr:hypothetical protein [Actinoallomurus sp.]